MEDWKKEADSLIEKILSLKDQGKRVVAELDGCKSQLVDILDEHNLNEYSGTNGKCNFVDFERTGLIKDKVEGKINEVNTGRITKIDIDEVTKDIKVHFISVKEAK